MSDVLGGFEHKVLLAMMRLGAETYSVPIVRELEALLWHAMRTSPGDTLELWPDFPALDRHSQDSQDAPPPSAVPSVERAPGAPPDRATLQAAMARHGGKQEAVWRELGLSSRHVLRRLLIKHGLLDAPPSGKA